MVQIATGIPADPARVGSGVTVEAAADEYGIRPADVRNALEYAARVRGPSAPPRSSKG